MLNWSEATFNDLKKEMKKESFRDDFYKKIKKFREYHDKVQDEKKLGKYIIDTFCAMFCDLKEYAKNMEVSENNVRQLVALALKGRKGPNNKTNSVRADEIEVLQTHSENYKIRQIREVLENFYRETNYRSVESDTERFFRCVTEIIRRYEKDDWEFID